MYRIFIIKKIIILSGIFLSAGMFAAINQTQNITSDNWAAIPFVKQNKFNPILKPKADSIYTNPLNKRLFDSRLCESGPAAISSNGKTLLLYNGMNLKKDQFGFCKNFTSDEYTSGQIQDKTTNPFDVRHRLDTPFMKVTEIMKKRDW